MKSLIPQAPDSSSDDAPSSPAPLLHAFDYELLQAEEDLEAERRKTMSAEDLAREEQQKESKNHAVVLEMLGDLPQADLKPPENVLFVCKLNAITRSEDLELIFSQCGEILACDVITDWKTGASLQYAFIEYAKKEDAERAYLKMNNVLIDERRIKVDFSQSVSKQWNEFRRKKAQKGKPTAASVAPAAAPVRSTPAPAYRPPAPAHVPAPSAALSHAPSAPAASSSSSRRSRSPRSDRDAPHRSHSRSRRSRSRSRERSHREREERHHGSSSRREGDADSRKRSRSPDRHRSSHHHSSSSTSHRDSSSSSRRHRSRSRSIARSPRRRSRSRSHGRR